MWTMIVAEDDIRLCGAIAAFARDASHAFSRVEAVHTVEDALAAIDEHAASDDGPLFVLSDLELRHSTRSGLAVLQHAQAQRPHSLRVLMSGADRDALPRDLDARGVHAFLPKPFLFQAVEELAVERVRPA